MKLIGSFTIPGTLPGLNDYSTAERSNRHCGASVKSHWTKVAAVCAAKVPKVEKDQYPVTMRYRWFEPNRRRDLDNISAFGRKVIQDGLVRAGVMENDGWKQICGFVDEFFVDTEHPRIEVYIYTEDKHAE